MSILMSSTSTPGPRIFTQSRIHSCLNPSLKHPVNLNRGSRFRFTTRCSDLPHCRLAAFSSSLSPFSSGLQHNGAKSLPFSRSLRLESQRYSVNSAKINGFVPSSGCSSRHHPAADEALQCFVGCAVITSACLMAFFRPHSMEQRAPMFAAITATEASISVGAEPGYRPAHKIGRNNRSIKRSLKYSTLKVFQQPVLVRVLLVIGMAIPISLLGGLLYKAVTGTDLKTAFYKSYHIWANSPGVDVVNEETPAAGLIVNALFVSGLLSFAVILGIITDEISDAVQQMRMGAYDVVESQHTVILGWNPMIIPVLRQMAVNVEERGSKGIPMPVVILADKSKEEMDSQIHEEELHNTPLVVMTRSGNPTRISDLEKVSASSADTVILLNPEGITQREAAVQKAASLMALETLQNGDTYRAVLMQGTLEISGGEYLPTDAVTERWRRARSEPLVVVPRLERSAQMLAQCAVEPGLAKVLKEVLVQSFDSAEFYLVDLPESLAGCSYKEARLSFLEAAVCGVTSLGGKLSVNPPDSRVMQAGDKLLMVASSEENIQPLAKPVEVPDFDLSNKRLRPISSPIKNVAVLSYRGFPKEIVQSLQEFSHHGTCITVITEDDHVPECRNRNGVRVRTVNGSPTSGVVLQDAKVFDADSVILCRSDHMGDNADAQVVGSVLQLQGLRARTSHTQRQNVVVVVNHPASQEVLEHINEADWPGATTTRPLCIEPLNTDQLVSGMLAQVTADPELHSVFDELFRNSGGCELYLRDPDIYHLPVGTPLPWLQVVETLRMHGQTAIGYLPYQADPVLGPSLLTEVTLGPKDRLVVVAED